MKATKIMCTVITETLSSDSVPALLAEAAEIMKRETISGEITKDDGDMVKWNTETKNVEF